MQSDNPIRNSSEDLFERREFARRIAEVISGRTNSESVVIGLHAPWGEGKSSVLLMVKEALQEHVHRAGKTLLDGDLVIFEFNPWRYADEETLLSNFFYGLAEQLEGRIVTRGERISELVKRYSFATAPLDTVKISAFGLLDLSLDSQKLLEKIADAKSKAGAETLKTRIEKILLDSEKKIVIIMDDIDRLDKREIQAVFRLVKLTAEFPNTYFLLSFDPERVAEALQDQYGSLSSARSFLEKIVQLSLSLPPLTVDKLVNYLFLRINELLKDTGVTVDRKRDENWSYFFRTKFGQYLTSPRQVKRYLNGLWFSLVRMKDEVDVLDLQTLEAIRTFLPDLYSLIRDNKELFLVEASIGSPFYGDRDGDLLERLKGEIEKLPDSHKGQIEGIIGEVFPRALAAFQNNHYGRDWYEEWNREKRIASPEYFDRYFQYGISSSDISDVEIGEFLSSLDSFDDNANAERITKFVTNFRAELFLDKLSRGFSTLNDQNIKRLARAIALSGGQFPQRDDLLLGPSPARYSARTLRQLVERLHLEEQHEFAVLIATIAEPLDFAYEFMKQCAYIGLPAGTNINNHQLSNLARDVQREIVNRTRIIAINGDLDELFPSRSEQLYRTWLSCNEGEVLHYLEEKFAGDPSSVRNFILHRYRQGWDVTSTARAWGWPFVIDALKRIQPQNEVSEIELDNYSSLYGVVDEDTYLAKFLTIANQVNRSEETRQSD